MYLFINSKCSRQNTFRNFISLSSVGKILSAPRKANVSGTSGQNQIFAFLSHFFLRPSKFASCITEERGKAGQFFVLSGWAFVGGLEMEGERTWAEEEDGEEDEVKSDSAKKCKRSRKGKRENPASSHINFEWYKKSERKLFCSTRIFFLFRLSPVLTIGKKNSPSFPRHRFPYFPRWGRRFRFLMTRPLKSPTSWKGEKIALDSRENMRNGCTFVLFWGETTNYSRRSLPIWKISSVEKVQTASLLETDNFLPFVPFVPRNKTQATLSDSLICISHVCVCVPLNGTCAARERHRRKKRASV